ncbi:MAG: response regulator transcription factor [Patescibacteria group bacterium]
MKRIIDILIIEDNYKLTKLLEKGLKAESYKVDIAYNGEDGLKKGLVKDYDLLILDLMLPKKDGWQVCKELRDQERNYPILVLTAKGEVEDKIKVLDSGADDYMIKPFSFEELLARMRSLLRRKSSFKPAKFKIANLILDPTSHEVKRGSKLISLSPTEYKILEYLMKYPNQVFTRKQILKKVWGSEFASFSNLVDTYIKYLRQKIDSQYKRKLIQTVRGVGYKISN